MALLACTYVPAQVCPRRLHVIHFIADYVHLALSHPIIDCGTLECNRSPLSLHDTFSTCWASDRTQLLASLQLLHVQRRHNAA